MKKAGLQSLVDAQREARRERYREELVELLVQHHGNISAVADQIGLTCSTLFGQLERDGLLGLAAELRPSKPTAAEEKAELLEAIRRHRGHLRGVHEELGISRPTLVHRMQKHGLTAEADALRVEAHLSGPRTKLPRGRDPEQRRARLIALLEECDWNVARACRREGIWRTTFQKMMTDLRVERPAVLPKRRERLHELIDALRLSRGVVTGAARALGVEPRTVYRWCAEFDVDPRRYRR